MTLLLSRKVAADNAFENFEFLDGCEPEASDGWADDGTGEFVRAIYIRNPDSLDGVTQKGFFVVRFNDNDPTPSEVYAHVEGCDIGAPAVKTDSSSSLTP
jgi:hypothetical protein